MAVSGPPEERTAAQLKDALYPLTAHEGAQVLVDLATFGSVDVDLLGVLKGAAHLLQTHDGELMLVTRDPRVREQLVDALEGLARVESNLASGIRDRDAD